MNRLDIVSFFLDFISKYQVAFSANWLYIRFTTLLWWTSNTFFFLALLFWYYKSVRNNQQQWMLSSAFVLDFLLKKDKIINWFSSSLKSFSKITYQSNYFFQGVFVLFLTFFRQNISIIFYFLLSRSTTGYRTLITNIYSTFPRSSIIIYLPIVIKKVSEIHLSLLFQIISTTI